MRILKVCWSAPACVRSSGDSASRDARLAATRNSRRSAEEGREDSERVAGGRDAAGQHERGIERGHVDVEDIARHPRQEHGRIPPGYALARRRRGHGAALVQALPEEEAVDLGRVSPQHHRLVGQGQGLGLDEIRWRQDGREAEGFDDVVARIGHEGGRILTENPRDVFGREVSPVGGGDPEVTGDVLEAVGLEITRAYVVELGEYPRVHDVAAFHAIAAVGDGALRDLHAGGIAGQGGGVAPPPQRHLEAARAGLHVLEVEAEDVVALEHVRIALPDDPAAFPEEVGLGISAPDSTVWNPVESAMAMAMIRSDSRAALGNSKPGAVVTSMSTAMRRRSPNVMPRKDVRPVRSKN
jgi:hypothetical protein